MAISGGQAGASVTAGAGLTDRGVPVQWRWLLPVTVASSVSAWLTAVSSSQVDGTPRVLLLGAGALFTAVAAGVPLWQQGRTARSRADAIAGAQAARAEMRIAIEDALEPFTALLLQLATARGSERSRLRGEAIQLALTSIAQLSVFPGPQQASGSRRVRVTLFSLLPGPPRQLSPQSFAGRFGAPTVGFDETTRAGQAMFRIVDNGWVIVPDLEKQRVVPWWDEDHGYRAYAAGPVPGPDGGPIGLLTLDAIEAGDLDGLDLPLIRLIAHLLSLALQI